MERELKYALSLAAFQALRRRFDSSARTAVQVNWYFLGDPEGPLAQGRAMLRLREEEGSYVLAFKGDLTVAGDYFVSEEVEAVLSASEGASALDQGLPRQGFPPLVRAAAVDTALHFQGAGFSRTERTKAPLPGGEELVLDACTFPGGSTDYEVEVETEAPDRVRAELARVARELSIELAPQERTKYRRFLDALGKDRL